MIISTMIISNDPEHSSGRYDVTGIKLSSNRGYVAYQRGGVLKAEKGGFLTGAKKERKVTCPHIFGLDLSTFCIFFAEKKVFLNCVLLQQRGCGKTSQIIEVRGI